MKSLEQYLKGMYGVSNVSVKKTLIHLDYHHNYCCIEKITGTILTLEVCTSLTISEVEQLATVAKFIKEFPDE